MATVTVELVIHGRDLMEFEETLIRDRGRRRLG